MAVVDEKGVGIGHITMMCALGKCIMSESPDVKLRSCSACKQVKYCCKEHQVEHFKEGGHQKVCIGRKVKAGESDEPMDFKYWEGKAAAAREVAAMGGSGAAQAWKDALRAYSCMLELTEKASDTLHRQCADLLDQMATCYKAAKRFEDATSCYSRIIIIRDFNNPSNDLELTKQSFRTMGKLAEAYMMAENFDIAAQLLEKAAEGAIEAFGEDDFLRGQALTSLGNCQARLGMEDEAIVSLRAAVALKGFLPSKDMTEIDKVSISNAYYNLGAILAQRKLEDGDADAGKEAEGYLKKCADLKASAGIKPDHPDLVDVAKRLSALTSAA